VADVVLREIEDGDLDGLFEQMRDAESVRMAAFVSRDPNDREAFDAHMARVRSAPGTRNRAITRDGHLVGSIASFVIEGDTEITYWIDRSVWGQGLASTALTLFLQEQQIRPVLPSGGRAADSSCFPPDEPTFSVQYQIEFSSWSAGIP